MQIFLITILSLLMNMSVLAGDISSNLRSCLINSYKLDVTSVNVVLSKFRLLIEDYKSYDMLENFIKLSELNLKNKPGKTMFTGILPNDDAVMATPQYHEVLAENDLVRILWGNSAPGEQVPLHRHYWASIFVMFEAGSFEIEYADGTKEVWHDVPGVSELPPDAQAAAYKNIGSQCSFLRFEIK